MSTSELERFASDIGTKPDLAHALEACAQLPVTSGKTAVEELAAFAESHGYDFTATEAAALAKKAAAAQDAKLTDEQLDDVAGGVNWAQLGTLVVKMAAKFIGTQTTNRALPKS